MPEQLKQKLSLKTKPSQFDTPKSNLSESDMAYSQNVENDLGDRQVDKRQKDTEQQSHVGAHAVEPSTSISSFEQFEEYGAENNYQYEPVAVDILSDQDSDIDQASDAEHTHALMHSIVPQKEGLQKQTPEEETPIAVSNTQQNQNTSRKADTPAEKAAQECQAPNNVLTDDDWFALYISLDCHGLSKMLLSHCEWLSKDSYVLRLRLDETQQALFDQRQAQELEQIISKGLAQEIELHIEIGPLQKESPALRVERERQELRRANINVFKNSVEFNQLLAAFDASFDEDSVRLNNEER